MNKINDKASRTVMRQFRVSLRFNTRFLIL
jgi:hypothetical protein